MPRENNIQLRRGSSENWTSINPVLDSGEIGYESDTGRFKIGNGSSSWGILSYASPKNLSELSDVTINNLSNGQFLTYNSTSRFWENKTIQTGLIRNNDSSQVGIYSNAGGSNCNALGDYSLAVGGNVNTYGDYSVAFGYESQTNSDYSFAFGKGAKTRVYGQQASSSGYFYNLGDAQYSRYHLRTETTNATPRELTVDGANANSSNRLFISPKSSWTFEIKLSAYNYTDNLGASFIIKGSIKRNNSNSTTLVGSVYTDQFYDNGMSSCLVSVEADDTNESLKISVTGIENKNILWCSVVESNEVRKATVGLDDDYESV